MRRNSNGHEKISEVPKNVTREHVHIYINKDKKTYTRNKYEHKN